MYTSFLNSQTNYFIVTTARVSIRELDCWRPRRFLGFYVLASRGTFFCVNESRERIVF